MIYFVRSTQSVEQLPLVDVETLAPPGVIMNKYV